MCVARLGVGAISNAAELGGEARRVDDGRRPGARLPGRHRLLTDLDSPAFENTSADGREWPQATRISPEGIPQVWHFAQFTVEHLTETAEASMLRSWIDYIEAVCFESGLTLADARTIHWSSAEAASLVSSYNSAARRHADDCC